MLFVFVKKKFLICHFFFHQNTHPKKESIRAACVMLLDVEQKIKDKNAHTHKKERKKVTGAYT